ncbi:MAG: DNA-binding MarR family transcriptional regulator [Patescibacteria group bacterium]
MYDSWQKQQQLMASIEKEIKQSSFKHPQIKANINIMFTANWLNNKIAAILKPHNLTHEQFNVLRILRGRHPDSMCQKDILERMIARQSNVTLIVKKLKNKKMIEVLRSDLDRREYVISITELGLSILDNIDKKSTSEIVKVNQLTNSEANQLSILLDKLRGD